MENKNMMDMELENVTGGAAYGNNYYTVKKGDTLGGIARKYGRTIKQLMQWNNLKNADALRIGQRLRVSPQ